MYLTFFVSFLPFCSIFSSFVSLLFLSKNRNITETSVSFQGCLHHLLFLLLSLIVTTIKMGKVQFVGVLTADISMEGKNQIEKEEKEKKATKRKRKKRQNNRKRNRKTTKEKKKEQSFSYSRKKNRRKKENKKKSRNKNTKRNETMFNRKKKNNFIQFFSRDFSKNHWDRFWFHDSSAGKLAGNLSRTGPLGPSFNGNKQTKKREKKKGENGIKSFEPPVFFFSFLGWSFSI